MSKFGMKRSKSSQKLLASGSETSLDQVKLEKVLGISVSSGASLSCDQHSGIVAYPAGCTVVLYNGKNGVQRHLINAGRKTITCLSFSPDGKYLATGECGHDPCVRVWDVEDGKQISELKGHKFGVCCVAFSPKNKHLVSVGNQHDQTVNVWNWKNQAKLATNKISSKVRAISFSESGQYFVTVGVRHVKFWYLEKTKPSPVVSKYKDNTAVPLQGRSAILSDQRNNLFCDVLCGQGQLADKTYCITQKGLLCEFNARRLLDRWVDLKTSSSNCIALGSGKLFVGCASGVVRVFDAQSLQYLMSLPQPHYLGVDVAAGTSPQHMIARPRAARYPDTLALCFDRQLTRLTCVYSDHSIYQWDVSDLKRVGKAQSHLYHCGCVWTVETYPNRFSDTEILPPGTFLTCGSDETVRIWNCDTSVGPCTSSGFTAESPFGAFPGRNIYSPELMKIMYLGQDVQNLVDSEATLSAGNTTTDRASDIGQLDGKSGIRSIRVSPEGLHLATGNRNGNVRVYDLQNMNLLMDQEAHDADVLCLEYSDVDGGAYLMASGSRDRLLHVFDVSNGYQPVGTIDDHSSSITCIKFVRKGAGLQMLSCGADKCIIFRNVFTDKPGMEFERSNCVAAQATLYDMQVDPLHKNVYTACQDRNIRIYNTRTTKLKKSMKGTLGEDGNLIKLTVDPSGTYIATSCTDKTVCILNARTGDCVAAMGGHSEYVTGVTFTSDFRHVITVSGDGCVFVWRLGGELTKNMMERFIKLSAMKGQGLGLTMSDSGLADPSMMSLVGTSEMDDDGDTDSTADTEMSSAVASPVVLPMSGGATEMASSSFVTQKLEPPSKPGRTQWAEPPLGDLISFENTSPSELSVNVSGECGNEFYRGTVKEMLKRFEPCSGKSPVEEHVSSARGAGDGQSESSPDQTVRESCEKGFEKGSEGGCSAPRNNEVARLIGSLTDKKGELGEDSEGTVTDSPVIYVPPSPQGEDLSECSSQFEVKERSEALKTVPVCAPANSRTSSTLGTDLSEDELEGGMSCWSPSIQNIKALNQSQETLHLRRKWDLDKAFGIAAEETSPIDWTDMNGQTYTSPGSGDSHEGFFDRNSSGRQSLTQRYLRTHPPPNQDGKDESRTPGLTPISALDFDGGDKVTPAVSGPGGGLGTPTVPTWKPPVPGRGRATWKSPGEIKRPNALGTLASYPLRASQASTPSPSSKCWTEDTSNLADVDSPVDTKLVVRAKSLKNLLRNKQRRLTLPAVFSHDLHDEDYSGSCLHARSRSPGYSLSPSRNYTDSRRDSIDSDFSFHSGVGGRSGSRGNLHTAARVKESASVIGIHPGRTRTPSNDSSAMRKLSDIREKLRKSQENLALAPETAEILSSTSAYSGLSRSKSYGSLVSTVPIMSHPLAQSPSGGLINTLARSRALAKSLGSLHQAENGSGDASYSRPRPLSETLRDIKRVSNPDLRNVGLPVTSQSRRKSTTETRERDESPVPSEVGSYYGKAWTLPKHLASHRGAVAKKVENARHRHGFDRGSVSGDSDGSTSDAVGFSGGRRPGYTRRYFGGGNLRKMSSGAEDFNSPPIRATQPPCDSSPGVGGARSRTRGHSDVRGTERPRGAVLDLKKEFLDGKNSTSNYSGTPTTTTGGESSPYRRSSYLAAKIMAGDELQPGPEEGPEVPSENLGVQSGFCEKMSKHCEECLDQLQASVDKTLQAYKLVAAEKELTEEERERLKSNLISGLKNVQERLGHTLAFGERAEPDGGHDHDERTSGALSPLQQANNPPLSALNSPASTTEQFLQQYSEVLVQMVQKQLQQAQK